MHAITVKALSLLERLIPLNMTSQTFKLAEKRIYQGTLHFTHIYKSRSNVPGLSVHYIRTSFSNVVRGNNLFSSKDINS